MRLMPAIACTMLVLALGCRGRARDHQGALAQASPPRERAPADAGAPAPEEPAPRRGPTIIITIPQVPPLDAHETQLAVPLNINPGAAPGSPGNGEPQPGNGEPPADASPP
jgi:hypothetical protein